ncbi:MULTISPECIES: thiamine ABC transporter substrate binding subunit [Ensifer]|jgi:thiamine transport system substrate-binding protein|uniref:Thiamine-binding periplasmic protein n=1 Tax=Ensifer canadensis TaxID=555315 RepID=A0AAW4FQP8_9HYPH|nr:MULTISPECIES: thiamine ABC transporter substrate binding subunit [Ensifer]AHK42762.1 thiamine ABC transporter periplasmic binding protein [Ensifer adhaerens OV14]MDP9631967.1 thiamine transport system substrate-binding protein [Ensifer adhaerens]KQW56299.1 thiamine ABC transporter substrate-binding protein [Ensifer sp. Root127]KQY61667.1 thiamine ABC transporter substrate-binding protein [Ensifer sp. Root142]MBD9489130.1 thiamine ABC transporter substrate binding subunit [Ensifer sp. ENS11]
MSNSSQLKVLSRLALAATAGLVFAANAVAADKTLTVYTYESFITEWGPGAKVAEAFEKTCECKVTYVGVADGVELLTRLKLEGAASKADIVLGLDTNLVAEAKATGFFAPHGIEPANVKVPGDFTDDTFLPYDYGHFAVVYDTQTLKTPPKSLKELVEGDASQKIVIEDPRTSTPGLGLLLWVKAVYGDEAGAAWAKLKDRVLTVTPGWSEAYGLFTKGEAPMVLSYTTSPAYHMVAENTDRYQAAEFSEGHYIQIEVAGMTKSAKEPELAKQFLAFMTGPEFQSIIPTTNWMMPVAATKEPLPEAFSKLVNPEKTFLLPSEEVAANRKAWIDEWLAAISKN